MSSLGGAGGGRAEPDMWALLGREGGGGQAQDEGAWLADEKG